MIESTIWPAAAPGAYHADVPSRLTISPPPFAVRSTIAWMSSSPTSLRSGTPPTVVALTTGTIWSPWPPSTIAVTSLTDEPVAHAMNVEKRAVSRMPAIPNTRRLSQPETFFAMCHVAKNVSGWDKRRVFGMAGILDTARFSTFIAWATGSSVKDVTAMVLGGHGDQMVPVVSATTVGGVPLRKLVGEDDIHAMVERTAKGGGEIVNLLGTSAWYAPGAAAGQMVDSIMLDEKRVLPCTAYLEGEYGIDGLYMGVPVKLGSGGIEAIYELELNTDEQAMLNESAGAVRDVVGLLAS